MAGDANAGRGQQLTRDRAGRHTRRGLTRARPFEDVPDVGAAVLGDAGEIGMTGPRLRDRRTPRARGVRSRRRPGEHGLLPVHPVAVFDQHRDRPADRLAAADAGDDVGPIGLDRHPSAAAVAALPAPEITGHALEIDTKPGGDAFENHDEGAAVRFASGEKSHHADPDCIRRNCSIAASSGRKAP